MAGLTELYLQLMIERWTRGDRIALMGLFISAVAMLAALVVIPEVRQAFGLRDTGSAPHTEAQDRMLRNEMAATSVNVPPSPVHDTAKQVDSPGKQTTTSETRSAATPQTSTAQAVVPGEYIVRERVKTPTDTQVLIDEYFAATDDATRGKLKAQVMARLRNFDDKANKQADQLFMNYCGLPVEWFVRYQNLQRLADCKSAGQILDYGVLPLERVSATRLDGCIPYAPQSVVLRGSLRWEARSGRRFLTLVLTQPICTVGRSFDPAAMSYDNIGRLTAIYSDNTQWRHAETIPINQVLSFRGELGGDRYFDGRTPVFIYGRPISEAQ